MYYEIQPTDVVHRGGREWKTHKYISKNMKKGKWVYQYDKNKARGSVTNKNGKTQYSPNVKTVQQIGLKGKDEYGNSIIRDGYLLMEPIKGKDLSNDSMRYLNSRPIRSIKFRESITNNTRKITSPKAAYTSYSPSQSSKAASSRHYTPDEKKKK